MDYHRNVIIDIRGKKTTMVVPVKQKIVRIVTNLKVSENQKIGEIKKKKRNSNTLSVLEKKIKSCESIYSVKDQSQLCTNIYNFGLFKLLEIA